MSELLDLRLFKFDVLADLWVVLFEDQLVGGGFLVLRRCVEVTGASGGHQADKISAFFLCHLKIPVCNSLCGEEP